MKEIVLYDCLKQLQLDLLPRKFFSVLFPIFMVWYMIYQTLRDSKCEKAVPVTAM